jgi:uncharacterized membrane protein (UPF0127 family)
VSVDPALPWRLRGLPLTRILGVEVPIATTRRARLLGLSYLDREEAGPGLLIPHCRSVHTIGMRFPLDLVFLDPGGLVLDLKRAVGPGRRFRCPSAARVLEVPSP